MRINQYVAKASGLSRRKADELIAAGRISISGKTASFGQQVSESDIVKLDDKTLALATSTTIMLNKPVGYVCSRNGQGARTIYDLLPEKYHALKPIGRLDKNSSGLLLLTNDGELAQKLTHPSFQKQKIYEILLDKPLQPLHRQMISDHGIMLEDGLSKFEVERQADDNDKAWRVIMREGRNRQIRRTFAALNYKVIKLHRQSFGQFALNDLKTGSWLELGVPEGGVN